MKSVLDVVRLDETKRATVAFPIARLRATRSHRVVLE